MGHGAARLLYVVPTSYDEERNVRTSLRMAHSQWVVCAFLPWAHGDGLVPQALSQ